MAKAIDDSALLHASVGAEGDDGEGTMAAGESMDESESRNEGDAMEYDQESSAKDAVLSKVLYDGSTIDRKEFVRLALQALNDIGYTEAARALQVESGYTLEVPAITEFRTGILSGKWETVEKLLLELPSDEVDDTVAVKFLIRQQKFLEALEGKETKKALSILRNELAPLNHDSDRLHFLSSLIMCSTPQDLRDRAMWDGAYGSSRTALLGRLQVHIAPSIMLPQRRLETLLEQAKAYQRSACVYHANDVEVSLLADCACDPTTFPSVTSHILSEHTDEIWRLEFSHDGRWLATAGKDKVVIIWNVREDFAVDKVLRDHIDSISCLSWSPDDSILLTAAEASIKMWNTASGDCIATLSPHEYPVGALSWAPNGESFVSGGMDSKINFWDLHGNVTSACLSSPCRILDLAVTPNGRQLVAVGRGQVSVPRSSGTSRNGAGSNGSNSRSTTPSISTTMPKYEKRITVFNMTTKLVEFEIVQPGELTSVSISKDSKYAIVSHAPNEILYIDLQDGTILRKYSGHDQGQYVLQSCFGGGLQNYVLSGSEDGQIYVWHRDTAALIAVLPGHGAGSINSVAWNPSGPPMFASASDDRTVRIWTVANGSKSNGATNGNGNGRRVAFS